MKDRRKIKRRYLLYYMRVYDTSSHEQIGNLVDITPAGMMVLSDHALPEGKEFHLRLELSKEVSDQPHMDFVAHSIWCQADVDPAFYNTGFSFQALSHRDAQTVRKIVENFSFRDNRLEKVDAGTGE